MAKNHQGFGVLSAKGEALGQVRYDLDEIVCGRLLKGMISGNGLMIARAKEIGSVVLQQDRGPALSIAIVGICAPGVGEVVAEVV